MPYWDQLKSYRIHLEKVEQQRSRDVCQRLHVEHLRQPTPAVVQTVRSRLKGVKYKVCYNPTSEV